MVPNSSRNRLLFMSNHHSTDIFSIRYQKYFADNCPCFLVLFWLFHRLKNCPAITQKLINIHIGKQKRSKGSQSRSISVTECLDQFENALLHYLHFLQQQKVFLWNFLLIAFTILFWFKPGSYSTLRSATHPQHAPHPHATLRFAPHPHASLRIRTLRYASLRIRTLRYTTLRIRTQYILKRLKYF